MVSQSLTVSPALRLVALANEKTSEKRLELLRQITEMFAGEANGASQAVRCLLDEIVTKLLDQIEARDRAAAASSLAQLEQMPESVARALAHDGNIVVARPIIQGYSGLSHAILVDLASSASQTHLEALAGRDAIGPDVTDIVARRGDGQVVRKLASNDGARFSRLGMRTMIDRAETDKELQELLVGRSDLSLEAVGQLLRFVSEHLAAKFRSSDLNVKPTVVQEHVISWVSDRKKSVDQVNRSIERIRRGAEKLDDVLMALVVEKRLLDVATVIAGACDFDRNYGLNLVTQGKTDSVVVLLRALAVGWAAAEGVLSLRINKLGSQLCGPMIDESTYESVDVAGAQRVTDFLKLRRGTLGTEKAAAAS